ncbi:MAG: hypothetical protein ACU843_06060 [Gammaproteobacteria bacterium]
MRRIIKNFLRDLGFVNTLEADELLDGLGNQPVELKKNPEDLELLNVIFRSFHTIKRGADFLNIGPLVAVGQSTKSETSDISGRGREFPSQATREEQRQSGA